MRLKFVCIIAAVILLNGFVFTAVTDFDLSGNVVDPDELISGGPSKDDIPAISAPRFIPGSLVVFLKDNDLVIGLYKDNEAKAYPLKILNWHEVVNDSLGGLPIAVTWCPLTRSAIVFERRLETNVLEFGVSGLLYHNNLVMYDRPGAGLWPQLKLGAVTGKYSKSTLNVLPSLVITWKEWKIMRPSSKVLSIDTGFACNYAIDPYDAYHKSLSLLFPEKYRDDRLSPKALVIGIRSNGVAKAYPLEKIKDHNGVLEDIVGGVKIKIHKSVADAVYITNEDDGLLAAVTMYWFAWSAFNKDTLLYKERVN